MCLLSRAHTQSNVLGACEQVLMYVPPPPPPPSRVCSDQAEARRQRVKDARKRREERLKAKRDELLKQYAKEDEAAAKK